MVSFKVEITERNARRCDQLMSHLLRAAFPGQEPKAEVFARHTDLVDLTALGDQLPRYGRTLVTTSYLIAASLTAELDGETTGIVDL